MLPEGELAIDFCLKDAKEQEVCLNQLRGQKVVLYFYPRANTPGCTKEAEGFRDIYEVLQQQKVAVVGISPDKPATLQKFREKYQLPFQLLSDPDHQVAESYGAWGEKKMCGKISYGILRSTFVIDEAGVVRKVFPKVSPAKHGTEVLEALQAL